MGFESSDASVFINYEPTQEDIRTRRNNWNSLKVGEHWISGYGTFEKTSTGYKLLSLRDDISNRNIAEFMLRCHLVCEACSYDLDTTIYEQ